VRELENDVSFLRNYLTEGLCEELDLFVFELAEEEEWTITEKRWEKVRDQLVRNMTNFGFPYMQVEDGDYDGNRDFIKTLLRGNRTRYALCAQSSRTRPHPMGPSCAPGNYS